MESRICRGGKYSALHTATVGVFGRKIFRPYSKGKKPSTKWTKTHSSQEKLTQKLKNLKINNEYG